MAASINLTAAVMMVLHAVLGCCWHHTHALSTTDVTGLVAPPASCCGHDHRGDHSHAPASSDEPGDDCDEHSCSVIAVVPTAVSAPDAGSLPAAAWFAPVDLASSTLALDAASHPLAEVAHRGPPHVPLRLLLGVLRI